MDASWSLSLKLAFSMALLVAVLWKTIVLIHDPDLRVNRISLVPIYAILGQAFFMCIYYSVFILWIHGIAKSAQTNDVD